MLDALHSGKITPSAEFTQLLRRSLAATGREEAFNAEMLKLLKDGDGQQPALFKMAVDWLISQQTKQSDQDPVWTQNIARNLDRVRRRPIKKTDQK
jgi:hypothetical protein